MSLYAEYLKHCPEVIRCLENARVSNRMAHSFLIHAADDRVRTEFAIVLQQLTGCHSPKDGRPDLNCQFCRQVENGTYTDLHRITPVGKMYQIRVGDRNNPEPNTLRYMLDHLSYTAGNHRKFGVIEDADRMGVEAQNALLKTLEEPPPETTLILSTANPASLLPTTRSRCQMISLPDFRPPVEFEGAKEVKQALFELCFETANDLCRTEMALQKILDVASQLAESARICAEAEFQQFSNSAAVADDAAFMKQLEIRITDAASGEYIRRRRRFVGLITSFCSQIFMLSRGVKMEELPNQSCFDHLPIPLEISEARGSAILKEAEELEYTLKFNVNDELALRTFAVNLAMR